MKFLEKADKLSKLLDLIEDVQVDGDMAIVRLAKNLVVVSEGSTMTINKGLAVSIAQFRHDNPIKVEEAFSSLTYTASKGFLRDLTNLSVKLQAERRDAAKVLESKTSGCGGNCGCDCNAPAAESAYREDARRRGVYSTNDSRSASASGQSSAADDLLLQQMLIMDMAESAAESKQAVKEEVPAVEPAEPKVTPTPRSSAAEGDYSSRSSSQACDSGSRSSRDDDSSSRSSSSWASSWSSSDSSSSSSSSDSSSSSCD